MSKEGKMAFLQFKGDLRFKVEDLSVDPEKAANAFLDRVRSELLRDMLDLQVIERIRKSGARVVKIDLAIGPASAE